MKKKFRCEVDCANCAAKLEDAIKRIPGVESVTLNFMMQKLTVVAADEKMQDITEQILRTAKKIEPDSVITEL